MYFNTNNNTDYAVNLVDDLIDFSALFSKNTSFANTLNSVKKMLVTQNAAADAAEANATIVEEPVEAWCGTNSYEEEYVEECGIVVCYEFYDDAGFGY